MAAVWCRRPFAVGAAGPEEGKGAAVAPLRETLPCPPKRWALLLLLLAWMKGAQTVARKEAGGYADALV